MDLAEVHITCLEKLMNIKDNSFFNVYNVGTGKGTSVLELINLFENVNQLKLNYKIGKRRKSDIVISISNPKKLIKLTNWKPKYNDLSYLLKSSLDWYKKNI